MVASTSAGNAKLKNRNAAQETKHARLRQKPASDNNINKQIP